MESRERHPGPPPPFPLPNTPGGFWGVGPTASPVGRFLPPVPRKHPTPTLHQSRSPPPGSLLCSCFTPRQLYRLCWSLRNRTEERIDLDAPEEEAEAEESMKEVEEEEPGMSLCHCPSRSGAAHPKPRSPQTLAVLKASLWLPDPQGRGPDQGLAELGAPRARQDVDRITPAHV